MSDEVLEFISFIIEEYSVAHGVSGERTYQLFVEMKVLEYLNSNFAVLHTMGVDALIKDIVEYIASHQVYQT